MSKKTIRLALFASGSGSNAENIINYFSGNERVKIELILSNKSDAFVHERAKRLGVSSLTLPIDAFRNPEYLILLLKKKQIDFIVLAGFLLLIHPALVQAYPNRIVNIHPALLPKFGGKGMYGDRVHKAVVSAKEIESGITIHLVNENYDEGSIVFQAKCQVLAQDSADDVASKVHELEYKHFPEVIDAIIKKEFVL
jgi:phosphoribosylglycinamide formyltransferase 1